jgi:methionyl-tRNA formyltransferase
MKIFLYTVFDPLYIAPVTHDLFNEFSDDFIGVGFSKDKRGTKLKYAKKFLKLMGLKAFIANTIEYYLHVYLGKIIKNYKHDIISQIKYHNIPIFFFKDVNSTDSINKIKQLHPDLIISIGFGKIFKKDILSIPKYGAINLHSSLIPKHRGLMPTFWALKNNDPYTGVTIHYMTEIIDDANIISQEKVPIFKNDTAHILMKRCKTIGLKLLKKVIYNIKKGVPKSFKVDLSLGNYNKYPTDEEIKEFKKVRKFR